MKDLFDKVSLECSKNVTNSYSTSFSLATKMLSKNIRQDFKDGKQLEACKNCWKEEEAGIQSKRQRENFFWKDTPHDRLTVMDLKLGNICNSKCRICSSFASSQWAAEEIALNHLNKEKHLQFNRLGQWPNKNEKF